jgi:hypothetical protein
MCITVVVVTTSGNVRETMTSVVAKLGLECLEDRFLLDAGAVRVWIGPDKGSWDNPANWSGGQMPGVNDTAEFTQDSKSATLTQAAVLSIGKLQLDQGFTIRYAIFRTFDFGVLRLDSGFAEHVTPIPDRRTV